MDAAYINRKIVETPKAEGRARLTNMIINLGTDKDLDTNAKERKTSLQIKTLTAKDDDGRQWTVSNN